MINELRTLCVSELDDLEALIYELNDVNHLRFLRKSLLSLLKDYTALLDK